MTLEQLRAHGGLLSVTEVAEALGFSSETIRRAIRRGELPASKPGGRLRIEPVAVLAWLQETTVTSRAPARETARSSGGASAKTSRRGAPGERGSFRERARRAREP